MSVPKHVVAAALLGAVVGLALGLAGPVASMLLGAVAGLLFAATRDV